VSNNNKELLSVDNEGLLINKAVTIDYVEVDNALAEDCEMEVVTSRTLRPRKIRKGLYLTY
jgi:hypothetical protein